MGKRAGFVGITKKRERIYVKRGVRAKTPCFVRATRFRAVGVPADLVLEPDRAAVGASDYADNSRTLTPAEQALREKVGITKRSAESNCCLAGSPSRSQSATRAPATR